MMKHLIYLTIIAVLALTASFYMARQRAYVPIKVHSEYADKYRLYEINDL